MKTAVYLRVSTEEQEPENQRGECLELVRLKGFPEPEVFLERASAWNQSHARPVFESLLRRAKEGEFSHIVVWDFDRLYRNRVKCVELVRGFNALGIGIHSVRQSYLDDVQKIPAPFNDWVYDLLIKVIAWIAEEESNKRSDRVKIAFKKKPEGWGRPEVLIDWCAVDNLLSLGQSLSEIAKRRVLSYQTKEGKIRYVSKATLCREYKAREEVDCRV